MRLSRSLLGCATLAAAVLLIASLSTSAASARSHGCRGLHLSAAKHRVEAGGWVRVRGHVCHGRRASRHVRIAMRGPHGWRVAVRARVHSSGRFSRRVRVGRATKVGVVHLRALQRAHRSNAVAVKLAGAPSTPAPPPAAGCALTEQPGEVIEMTLPGCPLIASDTASDPDPDPFWGAVECENSSRYSYGVSGGDPHLTATGAAQPDGAYRRLTVLDGDNFYGERCELGENNHRTGPTVFYHEGQHRVTYISERLPDNFPLDTSTWQTVMQMKQTQPSDDNCCGPQLEMQAARNKWVIASNWKILWEFPAHATTWTRFAWNVFYSQDPAKGWLQVSADLNGDGDFNDPGERSPTIHTATLRTEPDGPNGTSDGLAPGDPIPAHLRAGIYHDPAIPCPAPGGCSVEVDNVQVVGP